MTPPQHWFDATEPAALLLLGDIKQLDRTSSALFISELAIDAYHHTTEQERTHTFNTAIHVIQKWTTDPTLFEESDLSATSQALNRNDVNRTTQVNLQNIYVMSLFAITMIIDANSTQRRAKDNMYDHVKLSALQVFTRTPDNSQPTRAKNTHRAHALFNQIRGPLHLQHLSLDLINPTTTALARQVRAARDTSILPILADALQDAGCDEEELLHQLRHETSGHSPSSWVIRQLTP